MFIRHMLFVTAEPSEKFNSPFSALSGDSCLCYFNYRLGLEGDDIALPPCGIGIAEQDRKMRRARNVFEYYRRTQTERLTCGDGPLLLDQFRYSVIWLRHPMAYRMAQRWPESRNVTRAGDILVNYRRSPPKEAYVVLGALRHYEPTELRIL